MSKKYKYLYRLITISIFMLVIPLCLFVIYFWRNSYREVQKGSDAYYEKVTDSFLNQFGRDLDEMIDHAIDLGIESKTGNGALYAGGDSLKENTFWYYAAIKEFNRLNEHFSIGNCRLYYYEWDSIFTTDSRMSLEQYFYKYLQEVDATRLGAFFDPMAYREGEIRFIGNVGKDHLGEIMIVGFCTRFGANRDEVLVFYELTESDIMALMGEGYEDGVNFYVLDSGTDELLMAFEDSMEWKEGVPRRGGKLREALGESLVCEKTSMQYPLTYLTAITDHSRQSDMDAFYKQMRGMTLLLILLMSVLCFVALYLEYKPIYHLINDLENEGEDEISVIKNTLESRRRRIEEQELMIKELLVNHLVYGTQISELKLKKLGLDVEASHYCVYLLENKVLLTAEELNLVETVERECLCKLYIADLMEKEQSVIVASIEGEVEQTERKIRNWLQCYYGSEVVLKAGKAVEHLEEIRISFRSCLDEFEVGLSSQLDKNPESGKILDEKQKQLQEKILAYLDAHYRDQNLSQVRVADELHMSSYSLSRIFKSQVGVSYADYVNAKRLEYAKELLLTTDRPVQEIAVAAGYENNNYFYRIFKATFGMSATEFREQ